MLLKELQTDPGARAAAGPCHDSMGVANDSLCRLRVQGSQHLLSLRSTLVGSSKPGSTTFTHRLTIAPYVIAR